MSETIHTPGQRPATVVTAKQVSLSTHRFTLKSLGETLVYCGMGFGVPSGTIVLAILIIVSMVVFWVLFKSLLG